MKYLLICIGLTCSGWPLAGHATIYRCTDGTTVIYQDTPCEKGESSELIIASLRTESAAVPAQPNAATAVEETPRQANPPNGLVLGMFDTQVLNMRAWGRPAKIKRTKAHRAWREEWTYQSPVDGERQLEFANGKLTAIW